jgi:hypothetical protein
MSQPFNPQPPPTATPTIPNNMVLAIIASVVSFMFCCLPHGLIALIFALQVNKKEAAGDIEGANKSAKLAKMISWICIIVSVVWLIIGMVFGVFSIILQNVR